MNRLTAGLMCAASLSLALGGSATAQLAQGSGPIDLSADSLELVDAQHLAIWRGDVDALRGQNRLRSDVLNIYFAAKPGEDSSSASSGGAAPGRNWGKVDHMVAEGHVYYVSPTQNARSDHAVYDMAPDTITMTGDVIVVQGQSVIHGEKLIIDVRSGHATMAAAQDAHAAEDRGLLRQVADAHAGALVHGLGGDVLAVQHDAAAIGRHQAGDHIEAGGLARAIGTQKAHHLAAVQPQAHVLHHRAAAERFGDRIDEQAVFDRCRSGGRLGGFCR